MKNIFLSTLLLFVLYPLQAQAPVTGNPADLPFTLSLEEATQDELPGFHSGAFAQWQGWWIIVGGRIGGLHGFFPFTGFPDNEANTSIWLINPETGDLHNFPVDVLTIPFPDQLKSTNPQFVQDGDKLYICGGFGKEAASGDFITFPVLTAIQLPQLATALMTGANPSSAIRQIQAPNLRVCGGEMEKLGAFFYLVGGHDFSGKYSDPPTGSFSQVYTNEIRKFKVNSTAGSLSISDYSAIHDEQNLHRRDFTLGPIRQANGTPGLCLYGGVFRPDAALPFYNPVYITEDQPVQPDGQYEQIFSQYTCPVVPMFDSTDGAMYTVFFAGLSAHYVDPSTQSIQYDERVPFIRDITTFRRKADGTSTEFVLPVKFDALLGTNMIFAPAEGVAQYDDGVIKLRGLVGKTFVGYLFGGIKAEIPNLTPSSASNRMFKVYITPKMATPTHNPSGLHLVKLMPNPIINGEKVMLETNDAVENALLLHANGSLLATFQNDLSALEQRLQWVPPGVYFLKFTVGNRQEILRVVKVD